MPNDSALRSPQLVFWTFSIVLDCLHHRISKVASICRHVEMRETDPDFLGPLLLSPVYTYKRNDANF